MMKYLYSSPLRVYVCLGILALSGIYAGTQLPISLFPNSSKPIVNISMPYGNYTASEFMYQHGNPLETQLRGISSDFAEVEKTRTHYNQEASFEVEFKWGTNPRAALKEVEMVVHSYSAHLPEEIRKQIWVGANTKASGFFVASFYSATRSLDELYKITEPVLMPEIVQLRDIAIPEFWNPTEKELRIELNSERMSAFQLVPKDIEQAVKLALTASNAGAITVGLENLTIQLPRMIGGVEDLRHILISTPSKQAIYLSDVAQIHYDLKTLNTFSFKTSGAPSLILFAKPKPGGNIKRMSEEIISVIKSSLSHLPKDIEYKILVDPSEFIRSAIKNVIHEVAIGAFLAVLVLFVFIGSLKNTVTAAIEIPMSMILAFIPMKLSGMSLNLVSLGGLALSAGMNVDASVVVMENIFRHFAHYKQTHKEGPKSSKIRLTIVIQAVSEVKFAVISSTIASLVVFLPIAFTSDLSYAILGDLAKAVVFSHGFSAFVALILVPTVRYHLMPEEQDYTNTSALDKQMGRLEDFYVRLLDQFIHNQKLQKFTYIGLLALLIALSIFITPNLPKEVIGKPDTQDMMLHISTQGNTLLKQMEDLSDEMESRLLNHFSNQIEYTLVNAYTPNNSWIMTHLKDKSEMKAIQKGMQDYFTDTPTTKYMIRPFNPAELPIPDPPQLKIAIRGGTLNQRAEVTRDLYQLLDENQVFPRLWTEPNVSKTENVVLKPYSDIWSHLKNQNERLNPIDLADIVRVMTTGRKIGEIILDGFKKDVFFRYSSQPMDMSIEKISAIPIGLKNHLVPLKALSEVKWMESRPAIYQENQRELFLISGELNDGENSSYLSKQRLNQAKTIIEKWKSDQNQKKKNLADTEILPTISFEDAGKEVHEAMDQLLLALFISIALIFLILLLQFEDTIHALIVLAAIPLGFIGVLISLFVFRSTLSLNSLLGVILLNGIAVANSIILVNFLTQRVHQGLTPIQAALDTAKKRLRPILITSLTTILGMLPVALGLGEGGKILQPLGIAVSGGLWVSMGLTLIIVPSLQVAYLQWEQREKKHCIASTYRGEA